MLEKCKVKCLKSARNMAEIDPKTKNIRYEKCKKREIFAMKNVRMLEYSL